MECGYHPERAPRVETEVVKDSAPHELAVILRAWRDRLAPEAAGMPRGTGRRAPGLRREELAALAGVSVDYLVRLEQGRSTSPSPQVLASIARALRLTNDERDHLYRVAGAAVPTATDVPRHLTPSIQRIVDRLGDTPAAVFSATWDLISWNPLWAAMQGDPSLYSGKAANVAWRVFMTGESPEIIQSVEEADNFEHDLAADLRSASGRYPNDRALAELIATLLKSSARFADLWSCARVATHLSSKKIVHTAMVGPIALDCDVLMAPGSDLRVVVYTAEPGSTDAARLDLLRVAGLQSLVPDSLPL
jgi:transcriptional regulator with XRE-family HTH domain